VKARPRAATIGIWHPAPHNKEISFSLESPVKHQTARRQSTTRAELDDVDALLRKYTEIHEQEFGLQNAVQEMYISESTTAPQSTSVPMLKAPTMQRQFPVQSFGKQSMPNPFPYSSLLDDAPHIPILFPHSSTCSSAFPTQANSLSSSLASSRSNTYGQLPAPMEKLSNLIQDLQTVMPQAALIPQYKLDNLKQAVDGLLNPDDEAYAPQAFHAASKMHAPLSCAMSTDSRHVTPQWKDVDEEMSFLARHVPQSLVFVYEDGLGTESVIPFREAQ
jgi:hypothetical protein